jgi:uncharacterized membrane protein
VIHERVACWLYHLTQNWNLLVYVYKESRKEMKPTHIESIGEPDCSFSSAAVGIIVCSVR